MLHELLASIPHRTASTTFLPVTMIDTLFSYKAWLDKNNGSIGSAKGKKFAVVGAGAAGLVAAYQLAKAGAQVLLYEASDRPGGRMCSVQFDAQSPSDHAIFELGCMRFPPSSKTLYHYFDLFGIETKENFPDPGAPGVKAQLYYQNKAISWPPGNAAPEDPLFQRIGEDFGNMLTYLVGDPDQPDKDPSKLYYAWNRFQNQGGPIADVIARWQDLIDQYNNVSFEQAIFTLGQNTAIVSSKWTQVEMNAFAALGVGSGGFGPLYNLGFLEILRLLVNGFEYKQELVPGGISTLVDALVKACLDLGVSIYYNSPVTIRTGGMIGSEPADASVSNGPVDISYSDIVWQEGYHYRGWSVSRPNTKLDGVVVATTNRAMQAMGLTTQVASTVGRAHVGAFLSDNQKTALRSLHLTSSSKFFVRVKNKFWLEKDGAGNLRFPSNIQSDEIFRGLYCLDYCPNSPTGGGGVVLISYTWEDDSTKLLGMTKQQRFDLFLTAITDVNPEFAAALRANSLPFGNPDSHEDYDLTRTNMVDWQAQPNYYGAFKLDYPGTEQLCRDAIYQYAEMAIDGIAICGDSISWVGGWMEEALTSGLNAAVAVLAGAGGSVAPDGPLSANLPQRYKYDKVQEKKIY